MYDRYRRAHRWSDAHRRYWTERRERAEAEAKKQNRTLTPQWSDFNRQQAERRATRIEERAERREASQQRVQQRRADRITTRTTRDRRDRTGDDD